MDQSAAAEEGAPLKGTSREKEATDAAAAGTGARAGDGLWGSTVKRVFLGTEMRFVADAGGILTYIVLGSMIGYARACWYAGSVGLFGAFADFVRNQYDPW